MTRLNLSAEVELDPAIHRLGSGSWRPPRSLGSSDEPAQLFLTGTTGYLGTFLLHTLLTQTTATVHCLVRCRSLAEGGQRIRQALEAVGLWQQVFADRIRPVAGDVSKPRLGIASDEFRKLGESLDAIFHCAASVNFVLPYLMLKSANVNGTHEVLRLVSMGSSTLHYVSTFGTFLRERYERNWVFEEPVDDDWSGLRYGYVQSKWVAERLVVQAQERGLPAIIYRPSFVGWNSQTGVFNPKTFMCGLIRCCVNMGSAPDLDLMVDVAPADYVASAIAHIAGSSQSKSRVCHLGNPRPERFSVVMETFRALGHRLPTEPYDHWRERLSALQNKDSQLFDPLLPKKLTDVQGSVLETLFREKFPHFDFRQVLGALEGSSIRCPPIDATLLQRLVGSPTLGRAEVVSSRTQKEVFEP